MEKKIKFAFAVNNSNAFMASHFGDAEKYLVYEWNGKDIVLIDEVVNIFRSVDETHGSKKKGNAIIELLQNKEVEVLVSTQFGRNIKMVNQFFVPVMVDKETPEAFVLNLQRQIVQIEEELRTSTDNFKLFRMREGVLNTVIHNGNE